ncbi:ergothioneine biosynthesis protein EgtB [Silvanigrella aquatica]|uniref:Sulfatase maturase n=1 Tax=Silvanigrella aquatica TaxID=1915309 RepID=A0A1L4D0F1_9BACT|nr:ergothioneine biosynthesis protein EgtB [Silvanigrella aquatica]APJ03660.1 hypothetical protein AXG55_06965 [Silvanigrella aquatica]
MSNALSKHFHKTRTMTESICKPLSNEIFESQPADFTSPPKWHLGHSSWFFEEFILRPFMKEYPPLNDFYRIAFNSYYKSQGEHWSRNARGQISRPNVAEIIEYRRHVDYHILQLISHLKDNDSEIKKRIILGLNHEQQHQELLLMDIKYIIFHSFLGGTYNTKNVLLSSKSVELEFLPLEGGLVNIGANSRFEFYYDNEAPEFKYFQYPYALATRPINNREYLEFMNDGGYSNAMLWKSDGWDYINSHKDFKPLYWEQKEGQWFEFTLNGFLPLNLDDPVCHINYYEADAFAEWFGARLPTEFELELSYNNRVSLDSNFAFFESERLHPIIYNCVGSFFGLTGNLWEWTSSAYTPYPGYQRPKGAFGEYNQKFMVNQMVLKGGCMATPQSHFRTSYRNFFYPYQKWAFTGLRLAKDVR